ncbi:MAG TPA: quinone-dependent dihydroorotate dehydrogenase, partial [Desulfuromonadaceae bacterium]|nr:quinone-dependent dihydroorotate dehydrogenase [Desulfuromonadaceae bacterium]
MSCFYHKWVRPALFKQNAERAHNSAIALLGQVSRDEFLCDVAAHFFGAPELPIDLFGLRFPNPIGLAAGMDKFAAAVPVWEKLGFGFCELGGVTRYAQPGNPSPRMFRAVADEAIVNRMGFNNHGADAMAERLQRWRQEGHWPNHPVGINLGKSKATPLDKAADDYAYSFEQLRGLADFFVVNVSSPNTPGLRQLQDKAALDEILSAIQELNTRTPDPRRQTPDAGPRTPVLVKVAPDLSLEALDEILELVATRNIAGIVATNTTITRPYTEDVAAKKVYTETG